MTADASILQSPMAVKPTQDVQIGRDRRTSPDRLRRHRVSALTRWMATEARSGSQDVAGPTALDPFDESGMDVARAWFATEIERGVDPEDLRAEIATLLWPWAKRLGIQAVARLPRHCDAAEVHSRIATVLWQCCSRFDTEQSPAWSVWLSVRLRGAVIDAARVSDRLSRRDRRRVGEGSATGRVVGAGSAPVPIEDAVDIVDPEQDPSRSVVDHAVSRAVHAWLREDLPPDIASRVFAWWRTTGATTSLPAALAAEIAPYRFRLEPAVDLIG